MTDPEVVVPAATVRSPVVTCEYLFKPEILTRWACASCTVAAAINNVSPSRIDFIVVYAAFRLAMCAAVRMAVYPESSPTASVI